MRKVDCGDLLVAELLGGLLPLGPDGEVVHGEGGVPGHVLLHLQERRQLGGDLLVAEGGAGLQQHEALAAGVTGRVVDVELVVLVLVQKGPAGLEYREVVVVPGKIEVSWTTRLELHYRQSRQKMKKSRSVNIWFHN